MERRPGLRKILIGFGAVTFYAAFINPNSILGRPVCIIIANAIMIFGVMALFRRDPDEHEYKVGTYSLYPGYAPKTKRNRHKNRRKKAPEETVQAVEPQETEGSYTYCWEDEEEGKNEPEETPPPKPEEKEKLNPAVCEALYGVPFDIG